MRPRGIDPGAGIGRAAQTPGTPRLAAVCQGLLPGTALPMTTKRSRGPRLAVAALALFAVPLAACSDEDKDGATTDEEIEKVEKGVDRAEEEIRQEIKGQDQGSNEDNE